LSTLLDAAQYGTSAKAGERGDYPIIRMGNITYDGHIDLKNLKYIDLSEGEVTKYTVTRGDILFNRTNSASLVGKTAVYHGAVPLAFAGYLIRLRTNHLAIPEYVSRYLNAPVAKATFRSMAKSIVGMANINAKELGTISIPTPPLDEQARIVDILDQADELIAVASEFDARLEALKRSWFHETFGNLFSGPLIGVISRPDGLPRGWQFRRLAEVARLATGHTPSRRVPAYWSGDIPWLTLSDVRELDGMTAQTTIESVTAEGIGHSSAVILPTGTVCLSRTASVGFVTTLGRPMATSQDFVNWVCGPSLNSTFLSAALRHARPHLLALASGSTHRTIYFPTVESFSIVVPPLDLQQRFAERVGEVAQLRLHSVSQTAKARELFGSIQQRAFLGELTGKATERALVDAV